MRAISNEKRELLIAAKQRNDKEEDIAKWLGITKRSVAAIWRRFRETGSFLPTKNTGKKSSVSSEKIDEIHALLKKESDITLLEVIDKLSLPIKKSQLSRLLISLGYSFKKKQRTLPDKTALTSKRSVKNSKKR